MQFSICQLFVVNFINYEEDKSVMTIEWWWKEHITFLRERRDITMSLLSQAKELCLMLFLPVLVMGNFLILNLFLALLLSSFNSDVLKDMEEVRVHIDRKKSTNNGKGRARGSKRVAIVTVAPKGKRKARGHPVRCSHTWGVMKWLPPLYRLQTKRVAYMAPLAVPCLLMSFQRWPVTLISPSWRNTVQFENYLIYFFEYFFFKCKWILVEQIKPSLPSSNFIQA